MYSIIYPNQIRNEMSLLAHSISSLRAYGIQLNKNPINYLNNNQTTTYNINKQTLINRFTSNTFNKHKQYENWYFQ